MTVDTDDIYKILTDAVYVYSRHFSQLLEAGKFPFDILDMDTVRYINFTKSGIGAKKKAMSVKEPSNFMETDIYTAYLNKKIITWKLKRVAVFQVT